MTLRERGGGGGGGGGEGERERERGRSSRQPASYTEDIIIMRVQFSAVSSKNQYYREED